MVFRAYRLWDPGSPMVAGGRGAQIIYSAAVGRQSAPQAGAVSPHYLLAVGYEKSDAGFGCPRLVSGRCASLVECPRVWTWCLAASHAACPLLSGPVHRFVHGAVASTLRLGRQRCA